MNLQRILIFLLASAIAALNGGALQQSKGWEGVRGLKLEHFSESRLVRMDSRAPEECDSISSEIGSGAAMQGYLSLRGGSSQEILLEDGTSRAGLGPWELFGGWFEYRDANTGKPYVRSVVRAGMLTVCLCGLYFCIIGRILPVASKFFYKFLREFCRAAFC